MNKETHSINQEQTNPDPEKAYNKLYDEINGLYSTFLQLEAQDNLNKGQRKTVSKILSLLDKINPEKQKTAKRRESLDANNTLKEAEITINRLVKTVEQLLDSDNDNKQLALSLTLQQLKNILRSLNNIENQHSKNSKEKKSNSLDILIRLILILLLGYAQIKTMQHGVNLIRNAGPAVVLSYDIRTEQMRIIEDLDIEVGEEETNWSTYDVMIENLNEYALDNYGIKISEIGFDVIGFDRFLYFPLISYMERHSPILNMWLNLEDEQRQQLKIQYGEEICENLGLTVDYEANPPVVTGNLRLDGITPETDPNIEGMISDLVKATCAYTPIRLAKLDEIKISSMGGAFFTRNSMSYSEKYLQETEDEQLRPWLHELGHGWDLARIGAKRSLPLFMSPEEYLRMVEIQLHAPIQIMEAIESVPHEDMHLYYEMGARPVAIDRNSIEREAEIMNRILSEITEKYPERLAAYNNPLASIPDRNQYILNQENLDSVYNAIIDTEPGKPISFETLSARNYLVAIVLNSGLLTNEERQLFANLFLPDILHLLTGPYGNTIEDEGRTLGFTYLSAYSDPAPTPGWQKYWEIMSLIQEHNEVLTNEIFLEPRVRWTYNQEPWRKRISDYYTKLRNDNSASR